MLFPLWVKVNSVSHKHKRLKNQLRKDTDERLIQSWRPISLLNFDKNYLKTFSQTSLECSLVANPNNESSFVDGRFISEYTRLISDFLQLANIRDTTVQLLTSKKLFTWLIINFSALL